MAEQIEKALSIWRKDREAGLPGVHIGSIGKKILARCRKL
jgi:hypothetical protein